MSDCVSSEEVEYREVAGFPGYRVGNDGSVWSFIRRPQDPFAKAIEWRKLKPWLVRTYRTTKTGEVKVDVRYCVTLALVGSSRKKRMKRKVHVLVADAFLGARPGKYEVCHCDGNSLNNSLTNLRYDTRSANMLDCNLHGTGRQGEKSPMAKLSTEQVLDIKRKLKSCPVYIRGNDKLMAKEYGVDRKTISDIRTGKCWGHLQLPEDLCTSEHQPCLSSQASIPTGG